MPHEKSSSPDVNTIVLTFFEQEAPETIIQHLEEVHADFISQPDYGHQEPDTPLFRATDIHERALRHGRIVTLIVALYAALTNRKEVCHE